MRLSALVLSFGILSGCALDEATTEQASAAGVETPTITFGADWTQTVTGTLTAGHSVRINYDPARLPGCRGDMYGRPAWGIGGYFRVNGGEAQNFGVAGAALQGSTPVSITLPTTPGTLEMWFQVTSRWGCTAYDSNYAHNYSFRVSADPTAPGWVGNGTFVLSRATCNGAPCDSDRHPITAPWLYETWARQRAALRVLSFEVWKQGVTDFDNPNLWRQLDVRMYSRFGATGPFTMRHVSTDGRVGNNARYTVDLRAIDPLPDFPALTSCPGAPLTASPDGTLVTAAFEYYFWVNGVEYRPAPGTAFQGAFSNYKTPVLATCLPH